MGEREYRDPPPFSTRAKDARGQLFLFRSETAFAMR
jgi:hypothetical protein